MLMLTLLGVVTLSACKKEELPPASEAEAVLFLRGELEGQPFDYSAGVATVVGSVESPLDGAKRTWDFILTEGSETRFSTVRISFNNHQLPYGEWDEDLRETLFTGDHQLIHWTDQITDDFIESGVQIIYTDVEGYEYQTNQRLVSADQFFRVDAVEQIERDGISYHKLSATLNCSLYNPLQAKSINMTNTTAVLLFGGEKR